MKQLDRGAPTFLQSNWSDTLAWLVLFGISLTLFQIGDRVPYLALISMWVAMGVLAGIYMFCKLAAKQWPYVRVHINRESIASRLQQLEP